MAIRKGGGKQLRIRRERVLCGGYDGVCDNGVSETFNDTAGYSYSMSGAHPRAHWNYGGGWICKTSHYERNHQHYLSQMEVRSFIYIYIFIVNLEFIL